MNIAGIHHHKEHDCSKHGTIPKGEFFLDLFISLVISTVIVLSIAGIIKIFNKLK